MMIKYLKIIIIFLFFQYLLIHKTYAYTVFGDMTCGTILEKENDSTYKFSIKKWMQGYFSGRNFENNNSFSKGTVDWNTFYFSIMRYCNNNPINRLGDAAAIVYRDISLKYKK
jgi:hypothetical protein